MEIKKMKRFILSLAVILSAVLWFISLQSCSAVSNVDLEPEYDFASNRVITIYTIPSGHSHLDNTFSRVLHIDLQSRGYKIINANKILRAN
jgi:hypothetical protein